MFKYARIGAKSNGDAHGLCAPDLTASGLNGLFCFCLNRWGVNAFAQTGADAL